ncbi:hypothetical protein C8Q75DRAFT_810745 [Abortiporus biennis]|nr:hypothetical protein C8Q75DRAFT_810745 [Abortiporus biennis]
MSSSSALAKVSRHTLRQLKFILPGGLTTWYFDSHHELWRILEGEHDVGGWARTFAAIILASALLTISLFLYILTLPLITGEQPNYRHWRQSGVLSRVIPVLTTSILTGWSLLSYTLGHWSSLGYVEGTIASTGLYALSFGLLGLLPAPQLHRR